MQGSQKRAYLSDVIATGCREDNVLRLVDEVLDELSAPAIHRLAVEGTIQSRTEFMMMGVLFADSIQNML